MEEVVPNELDSGLNDQKLKPNDKYKWFRKYFSGIAASLVVLVSLGVFLNFQAKNGLRTHNGKVSADETVTLSDVQTATGTTIINSNLSALVAAKLEEGVYSIRLNSSAFPCVPGTDCEPDKYEVRYSGVGDKIFGLGIVPFQTNKAELDDFLDTSFGFGHEIATRVSNGSISNLEVWNGDSVRGRVPILVIPQKSLIIMYVQPEVKMMRLTRNINTDPTKIFGCPIGSTCMVFKKHNMYPEGITEPLVIIKGSNLADAYARYFDYLDMRKFVNKKPQYATFGINWETFQELGCSATAGTIVDNSDSVLNKFLAKNIKLSTVTVGSGYWATKNTGASVGCETGGGEEMLTAATDVFSPNLVRFPNGLNNFYGKLKARGIVPIIGMRPQVQPGNLNNDNVGIVANKFGMPIEQVLLTAAKDPRTPAKYYSGFTFTKTNGQLAQKYNFQLNVNNQNTVSKWADLLSAAYGNFGGFKYDDMRNSDNVGYVNYKLTTNTVKDFDMNLLRNDKDNMFDLPFNTFNSKFGNNFLIFSLGNWFSQPDAVYNLCASSNWGMSYPELSGMKVYLYKYCTDAAINMVMSGMPFVTNPGILPGIANLYVDDTKLHFVRQHQLATWFPVTMYSPGFWRLRMGTFNTDGTLKSDTGPDTQMQNVVIWNMQMRERMHRYIFDYASRGYEDKTTYLMRPLMFDYPGDTNVYNQYTELTSPTDVLTPKDEFMFGKALLVRPVFSGNTSALNVYFPEGKWLPLISNPGTVGTIFTQGLKSYNYTTLNSSAAGLDYPVFLKEGEIFVVGDGNPAVSTMWAYVFLNGITQSNPYISYDKNGNKNYSMVATKSADGNSVTISATKLNSNTAPVTMTGNLDQNKKFFVVNVSLVINDNNVALPTPMATVTPTPTSVSVLAPSATPVQTCVPPVSPVGLVITCTQASSEFRWNALTGVSMYYLRIDDQTANSWNGSCSPVNDSDTCVNLDNNWITNNCINGVCRYIRPTVGGHTYNMWIHSVYPATCNPAPGYSVANSMLSTCPAPTVTPTPTLAPQPISCTSWTSIYINNCIGSKYGANSPDCLTTASTVQVNNIVAGASVVKYTEAPAATACTSVNFSGVGSEGYKTSRTWTLSAGTGEKKVCAQFSNSAYSAICGAMIRKQ